MLGGFAMNNKLQGKDLINIGIFTAIYFIVIFAAASIGFIPIFIPLISVIVPLVGGIPMMLFFSKIKKFGMLTICGVLLGIIMLLTGMGWWCIPTGLIFGLISDFMMKACDYKNAKREVLIHGVFSMWVIGAFIPIVVTRDAYYQSLLPGYGQEYADTLMAYMPDWILPALLIAAFVSGDVYKRHVHETGRIYDVDLEDISQRQEQLWDGVKEILTQLSKLS